MLLVALAMMIDMAWARKSWGSGLCTARNAAEVYCVNHGGAPKMGSVISRMAATATSRPSTMGTCPGKGYYDELMWQAEAYRSSMAMRAIIHHLRRLASGPWVITTDTTPITTTAFILDTTICPWGTVLSIETFLTYTTSA